MRIAIDGTAAAVQTAGVGRYTRELLRALLTLPGDDRYQIITASDRQAAESLYRSLPPGALREIRRLPAPERIMTATWHRLRIPVPVEVFAGNFDVFHGTDFVAPPTRRPVVVTIHDLSYLIAPDFGEPSLVSFLKNAVPRSLQRANQIITVSASVAAELIEAYPFAEEKVRAIPNGVTVPQPRSDTQRRDSSNPKILIVGTIEPRKNHLTLLAAMPYVWERYPDAELVIAGRTGWRSDDIVAALQTASAGSPVTILNSPSDSQLDRVYHEATLFAYPSYYEGFGLPVLEAMARGIPVIAGDIPSLRETGGNVARYVDVRDAEALGQAIVALSGDPDQRDRMAVAGYQRASGYSWIETARRTRLTYDAAIEGNV